MPETFSFPYSASDVIPFFKLLANETRLFVVRVLVVTDLRAGEVGQQLQLLQNVVSYHLTALCAAGLLQDRRSAADADDI